MLMSNMTEENSERKVIVIKRFLEQLSDEDTERVSNGDSNFYNEQLLAWIYHEIDLWEKVRKFKSEKIVFEIHGRTWLKVFLCFFKYIKNILAAKSTGEVIRNNILENEEIDDSWPCRWFLSFEHDQGEIPLEICNLPQLITVIVRGKQKHIPAWLWRLKDMKTLDLQSNLLSELPETLIQCENLEELILSNNKFELLPTFLEKCPKLTILRKSQNWLMNEHIKPYIFVWTFKPKVLIVEEEKTKLNQPESLKNCAIESVLSNITALKDISLLNIYNRIKRDVIDKSKDFLHCDSCGRICLKEKGYYYSYVKESFVGCSYTPLVGICCSRSCVDIKVDRLKNSDGVYKRENGTIEVIEENAFDLRIPTNYYGDQITMLHRLPPGVSINWRSCSTRRFRFCCFR